MKLVILGGTSCSGKSTVLERIMAEKEGYFHLGYDNLKWQFSRYVSGKYYEDIHKLMLTMLNTLCEQKHDVICEAHSREYRERLIDLGKQHGYEVLEINFEAAWEVLLQRFKQRMQKAKADPKVKIANRTPERFKELYDIYERDKNPAALTFRTDQLSIEEVSQKVLALL